MNLNHITPENQTESKIKDAILEYGKHYKNGNIGITPITYRMDNIEEDENEDFLFNYGGEFDVSELNAFIIKYSLAIQ